MIRTVMMRLFAAATMFQVLAGPAFGQDSGVLTITLKPYHPAPRGISRETVARVIDAEGLGLPLAVNPIQFVHWSFTVTSSRDGNTYPGLVVGHNALVGGANPSSIPVQIVPVIVSTVALGTAIDIISGAITLETGAPADSTTFNPTSPDGTCLSSPNNIPAKVFRQSPLFNPAHVNFGGTEVGFTQYADAFQRASFWRTINRDTYHVQLSPVKTLPALTFNVPAPVNGHGGLALDLPALIPGACGRLGLVDVDSVDAFVTSQFAALAAQGVNPRTFPIFLFYNTMFPIGDPTNLVNCCAGGYHSAVSVGAAFQTYSAVDFDATGIAGVAGVDTAIASHEVAEWMNDPLGLNATPAWGNIGQVVGCQNTLEVADPLSGTEAPRIFMPNQFTYHLQEMAFFSWFFGAVNGGPSSIGVHGWFSSNGTFLTDAGAPCL